MRQDIFPLDELTEQLVRQRCDFYIREGCRHRWELIRLVSGDFGRERLKTVRSHVNRYLTRLGVWDEVDFPRVAEGVRATCAQAQSSGTNRASWDRSRKHRAF